MIQVGEFYLRPVEEVDIEWVRKLRLDPATWPYLGSFRLINSWRQQKWFCKLMMDSTREYLIFAKGGKKESKLGIVRLTKIDWINRSVCVGGDIVPDKRSKGYGKYMYKLILKLGFEIWGMNRLWLLVLENNKIALNLYKKLGFKQEGIQRKAIFRNGKFIDYILMAILAGEYWKGKR